MILTVIIIQECGTPLGTEPEDAEYSSEATTPQLKKKRPRRDRDSGVKFY